MDRVSDHKHDLSQHAHTLTIFHCCRWSCAPQHKSAKQGQRNWSNLYVFIHFLQEKLHSMTREPEELGASNIKVEPSCMYLCSKRTIGIKIVQHHKAGSIFLWWLVII